MHVKNEKDQNLKRFIEGIEKNKETSTHENESILEQEILTKEALAPQDSELLSFLEKIEKSSLSVP